MNTVAYYSNTSESENIAKYLAAKLECDFVDITKTTEYVFGNLIFVFPVYCQNVPQRADEFLGKVKCENMILIATFGKMSYGNVLREIQDKYEHNIISASYVPTKHTYLDEERFSDFSELDIILSKLEDPSPVNIPKSKKSFWADIMTQKRSRMGVRIIHSERCTDCGICTENCPENAIENGKTNKNCIRCLRCVANCPEKALDFRLIYPLRKYLSKPKNTELSIYI